MYSLWNSKTIIPYNDIVNLTNIICNKNNSVYCDSFYNNNLLCNNENINYNKNIIDHLSTQLDIFHWILSLNMINSSLIAKIFYDEEIDGEVLLLLNKNDIHELFKEYNLEKSTLFWLKIHKIQKTIFYLNCV